MLGAHQIGVKVLSRSKSLLVSLKDFLLGTGARHQAPTSSTFEITTTQVSTPPSFRHRVIVWGIKMGVSDQQGQVSSKRRTIVSHSVFLSGSSSGFRQKSLPSFRIPQSASGQHCKSTHCFLHRESLATKQNQRPSEPCGVVDLHSGAASLSP